MLMTDRVGVLDLRLCDALVASSIQITFALLPEDDPKQPCSDVSNTRQLVASEPKLDLETSLRLSMDYRRECLATEESQHCHASREFRHISTLK